MESLGPIHSAWTATGPFQGQANRLGFGWGGQGSWAGPAWFWLGGPRVLGRTGLGLAWGAKGPGPGRLGLAWGAKGPGPDWLGFGLGGPRVLGRTGLVLNTLKNHDSDEDVNIVL